MRQEIDDYIEIYVKTSIAECMRRDPKGLYEKALAGKLKDMTGIDDPYEEPTDPELVIETEELTVLESTYRVIYKLEELGYLRKSEALARE